MTTMAKATFPVVGKQHGETIRRNAETGVEIRSSKLDRGGMEHSVYVPDAEHGYRLADYFGELTSAREEAADRVIYLREAIAAAYAEAMTEAERIEQADAAAMLDPSGMDPAYIERLGFRVRSNGIGTTLWTHTLTGVMIGKFPGEAYAVTVPVKGAHVEVVAGFDEFPTLAAALTHAMTLVVRWTQQIQADHAEALDEDAHREGLAICASIPAEGRPAAVTELLTAAELLTDEREHLAAVRAARKLYDEHFAPCPETDAKRVMLDMLATACGFPYLMRAWAARHGMSPDGYTIEGIVAAYDADHAEALRHNR